MKLFFQTSERKKEKKRKGKERKGKLISIVIGGTASQRNDEPEIGSQRVGQILYEKNQTLRNWNFSFNLEVNNLLDMTYESCDERGPAPAERKVHRDLMIVWGSQHPIVTVLAEFVWKQPTPLFGGRHKDSLSGSREQQWIELIAKD